MRQYLRDLRDTFEEWLCEAHEPAKHHNVDHDVCLCVPSPVSASGVILDSQND